MYVHAHEQFRSSLLLGLLFQVMAFAASNLSVCTLKRTPHVCPAVCMCIFRPLSSRSGGSAHRASFLLILSKHPLLTHENNRPKHLLPLLFLLLLHHNLPQPLPPFLRRCVGPSTALTFPSLILPLLL